VVIPGFEFADYNPGEAAKLGEEWPAANLRIKELGLG